MRKICYCKKRIPKRYLKSHQNSHSIHARKREYIRIVGKKFARLWRIKKHSPEKQENIRLARARRKQIRPMSLKFSGPVTNPPKPAIILPIDL